MGRQLPFVIEAVVFFTCACSFSMDTLLYEFIYQTVSEELNYTSNHSVEYCAPNQSQSEIDRAVADQASKWTMYASLCSFIPCMVGGLLLTSWSDKIGRKKAIAFPVAGTLICAILQMFIVFYRLPLYFLMISEFVYGAFGAYSTLLSIGSAYLSDTVKVGQRGKRYTILEVSASFGGGASQIATGYWVKGSGFVPPSIFIVSCGFVALLLVPFLQSDRIPPERSNQHSSDSENEPLLAQQEAYGSDLSAATASDGNDDGRMKIESRRGDDKSLLYQLKIVWRLYTREPKACDECRKRFGTQAQLCSHVPSKGKRVWRLWFYVISFSIYMFAVNGEAVFRTMFLVSYPVCFTPELVGAQAGLSNGLIIAAPLILIILQNHMGLRGQSIVIIGILSRITSCAVLSFSRSPFLVFLGTSFGILYNFSTAFMRSEATKLVSADEQGSALSVFSGFESFIDIFSPIAFLYLYPASLQISHGFAYVVTSLIYCLPFVMMLSIWIAQKAASVLSPNIYSLNHDGTA